MKSILLVLWLIFGWMGFGIAQEEIQEQVEIINIEIPLRVLDNGKLVGGLKKADFLIFENGNSKPIQGFNEYRRCIKISDITLDAKVQKTNFSPRLFVLIFRLTDFHLDMEKGIDFLFEKIMREQDHIMILVNNTFIPEKTVWNMEEEKENLKKLVRKESILAKQQLNKVLLDVEEILSLSGKRMSSLNMGGKVDPLNQYKNYFQDLLNYFLFYKKNYLLPDLDAFYNFAKYLEKIKLEKWVIDFYQLERFPKFKIKNRQYINQLIDQAMSDSGNETGQRIAMAMLVQRLMNRVEKEMNMADDFPVREISSLFFKVNATFHSIFMRANDIAVSEDFEYKRIASDLENSLREITKKTGGELIASNNLETSLQKIASKEDIFYILTYTPQEKQKKKRKIQVRLKDKSYELIYDNNIIPDFYKNFLHKKRVEFPDIKITKFRFEHSVISFFIENFKTMNNNGRFVGKVEIHIQIIDGNKNVVLDQSKMVLSKEKEIMISIRLNQLERVKYFIFLSVKDLITNKTDNITKIIQ
jgi:hypothetical protein